MRLVDVARTAVLCSVELVGVMGTTLVLTLLPIMLGGSADAPTAAAVSTAYAVGFGGFLVLGGRLADAYGHVRAVVLATGVFALAGLGLVLTSSGWAMAVARLVQGLAAAVLVPGALALLTQTVEAGPARRRAMAAWGAASAAGGATGFLAGGAASALGRWQVAFLAPALAAILLALMVAVLFRHLGRPTRSSTTGQLDLGGGLLVTATIGLMVAGASLSTTSPLLAATLLTLAGVSAAAALAVERRARTPVLQAETLRKPEVRTGSAVAFVNTATTSSSATLLTLTLQAEGSATASTTALTMLPFSVAVIIGSALAPRLMARRGDRRACAAGLAVIALGTALLPLPTGGLWLTGSAMALAGLGIGVSAAGSTHLGTSAPGHDQAPAAAVLNTAAQLGTAVGVAISLAAAQLVGPSTVWVVLAALAAATALLIARSRATT